ncbi:MAG: hypothetical protein BRC41_13360 [Cyanobacteria bacterium QH_9_48_43]|nr:MAG: hypothetical protein BRC41_13360 [Cyanobacteria bacterium QH_9_48_43]PSO90481.1 MAG: hypothetical protein BRC43_02425 [Cyanobacteria bacterium QS_3_48_167]PSO98031.1 MAG: hypothetical protein BRC51_15925 [Cyanobacteria bacterium SW_12_48_29]PSP08125.1 MAG: hypothetical protein BRC49_16890 [Cyanobacteria bacterium SW_10_48_33]PSP14919.1 MAG: hypothetical protein BRC52_17610 [Cyanobacteria bacterium SW_5_48_44]
MMLLKGEIRRSGDEGKEDAPDTGSKRQRSREAGEKEDTGTRGRGELRDTQISARRSQGFEGTSNPVSLSSRHPLSASVPKGLSAPLLPLPFHYCATPSWLGWVFR